MLVVTDPSQLKPNQNHFFFYTFKSNLNPVIIYCYVDTILTQLFNWGGVSKIHMSEKWSWPLFLEKVHILYNVRIFQDKKSTIIQKYWNKKNEQKEKNPNEIQTGAFLLWSLHGFSLGTQASSYISKEA